MNSLVIITVNSDINLFYFLYNKYKLSSDELYLSHTQLEYNEEWNVFSAFNPSKCTHTWSSGQPTVQRPGSSRGIPVGAGIRTHNLGLPRVSSPTLYPLGQRLASRGIIINTFQKNK